AGVGAGASSGVCGQWVTATGGGPATDPPPTQTGGGWAWTGGGGGGFWDSDRARAPAPLASLARRRQPITGTERAGAAEVRASPPDVPSPAGGNTASRGCDGARPCSGPLPQGSGPARPIARARTRIGQGGRSKRAGSAGRRAARWGRTARGERRQAPDAARLPEPRTGGKIPSCPQPPRRTHGLRRRRVMVDKQAIGGLSQSQQ